MSERIGAMKGSLIGTLNFISAGFNILANDLLLKIEML